MRTRDSVYFLAVSFLYFFNELIIVNAAHLYSPELRDLSINIPKTPDFNDRQVQQACNMVNARRSRIAKVSASDMLKLQTSSNVTKTIKEFLATPYNGVLSYSPKHNLPLTYSDWGYDQNYLEYNVAKPVNVRNYSNFHIMNLHELFLEIAKKYNVEHIVKRTMVVGHDTWKATNFPAGAYKILNLRLNQGSCMNYSNCARPLPFDHYQSCSLYPDINNLPSQCLWFYWYYPLLVGGPGEIFSFINLHVPGRWVGNPLQTQAWLFVIFRHNNAPILNNIPYKQGASCSECPPETIKCEKSLCVTDPFTPLTSTPTLIFIRQPSMTLSMEPTSAPSNLIQSTKKTTNNPNTKGRLRI